MRQLPPGKFDAIITDPPYSSGGLSMSSRQQDPVSKYVQHGTQRKDITFHGDQRDQRSWSYWLTMCLILAADQLRTGGRLYMFSDWRQLPTATDVVQAAGLLWRGIIAWDKGRGSRAPHTGYHRHQCEYIVWATKGNVNEQMGEVHLMAALKLLYQVQSFIRLKSQ
jgi:site-specific DNA-methyltransferase (adenine-specific)